MKSLDDHIPINNQMKCCKCSIFKEITEFTKDKRKPGGRTRLCKKCHNGYCFNYRKNNPEKTRRANRNWTLKNKEYKKKYSPIYIRKRKLLCPRYRSEILLRAKFNHILRRGVDDKFYPQIGCTPRHLKNYLESQFKEGMSWNNHGVHGWHVDHIRPVSSFDVSDKYQAMQCFHWTNCQPLFAEENRSKSNRVIV